MNVFSSILFSLALLNITPDVYSSIALISGNLNAGDPIIINAGSAGTYTSESAVSSAETAVIISPDGFEISATSDVFNSFSGIDVHSAEGSLEFNVLETGFYEFQWSGVGELVDVQLMLDFHFHCWGDFGCFELTPSIYGEIIPTSFGELTPSSFGSLSIPPIDLSGELFLQQGEHSLIYEVGGSLQAGVGVGGSFDFSLQSAPVPLPAALWLFVTGLATLLVGNLRLKSNSAILVR